MNNFRYYTQLSGGAFNQFLIIGVMFISLSTGLVITNHPNLFLPILTINLWLLGYHHVISTYTKLAGTSQERKDHKFLIVYLPIFVFITTAVFTFLIGSWLVMSVYYVWQWYHYTKQSHGIALFLNGARPLNTFNIQLHKVILWLFPVAGLLYRCSQSWHKFLYTDFWLPVVPVSIAIVVAIMAILVFIYWLYKAIGSDIKNMLHPYSLFMLSHQLVFFISYISISDLNIGWITINIWHNFQYILFVWNFNRKRFQTTPTKSMLSQYCQAGRLNMVYYFATCLGGTIIFYKLLLSSAYFIGQQTASQLTWALIIFQSINFHHYIVDSKIWKVRKKTK